MEEKIDVEVIRYFVIIAFIGLWSIFFAIWGYTFEHYLSISIFLLLSTGICFLRKKILYKLFSLASLLFVLILSNGSEGLLWDFSIIFIVVLLLIRNENEANSKLLKVHSKNFFSCCYKYSLMIHDLKSILPKEYDGKIKRNSSEIDIGKEFISVKKFLNAKNEIRIYSPLYIYCEKEFILGLSFFLFLLVAKNGQTIYLDDHGISILDPNKSDLITEFQRFVRYSLNGNVEIDDFHMSIIFF